MVVGTKEEEVIKLLQVIVELNNPNPTAYDSNCININFHAKYQVSSSKNVQVMQGRNQHSKGESNTENSSWVTEKLKTWKFKFNQFPNEWNCLFQGEALFIQLKTQ